MKRVLHDLGDLVSGRPHDLHLTYSQHYCAKCKKYFNADMSDLAPKLSRGHPSKQAKKAARNAKRIQQKIVDLFEHR